ncbi:MAG: Rad52/Rad22 family DNA repair protein [Chryseobacterium sp.]|nr:Rad52/Rad22 family DNA repair protein [Chryseobacterium sp.]MDN5423700.1 Rad52/Rad22 family DNA repair protein [Chryseobacterium sp.]MDN5470361.1 Rad52/Rad22 family DNA repair protein [Lactococcus lactis]MDN5481320.1 Rad52/Rad22 family DNA repair protein [Chryseobacterium sp.]
MIITEEHLVKLKEPLTLKWRVKALLPDNQKPTEMILVGYVDARQVQDRFDNVLGAANWQDEYFECKNKQFCRIGVKIGNEWIWKGDSGAESLSYPGKGETSDSFKRAAVHWGVNRDTYELGEITIKCKMFENNPAPVDRTGNKLSGPLLLAECKRISALNDSELIFDRMVLPAKIITSPQEEVKKKRNPRKPKVILP